MVHPAVRARVGALAGIVAGGLAIATTYLVIWATVVMPDIGQPAAGPNPPPLPSNWAADPSFRQTLERVSQFASCAACSEVSGWWSHAAVVMTCGGAVLLSAAVVALLTTNRRIAIAGGCGMALGSLIIAYATLQSAGPPTRADGWVYQGLFMGLYWIRGPGIWLCAASAVIGLIGSAWTLMQRHSAPRQSEES